MCVFVSRKKEVKDFLLEQDKKNKEEKKILRLEYFPNLPKITTTYPSHDGHSTRINACVVWRGKGWMVMSQMTTHKYKYL